MPPSIAHASGSVMGGAWQVKHLRQPGIDPEHVAHSALAALQLVDLQMSPYKPRSDLMRLNAAPLNTWVDIPTPMAAVIRMAETIGTVTDGAIDITIGDAINAWGFGALPTPDRIPPTAPTHPETTLPAYELRTDNPPAAVMKHRAITFDLCAVAKGFAVDQAASAVRALGIESFLIEAAGEVYAEGHRSDGSNWQIGLELPIPGATLVYDQLCLDGHAIATSGSYRNRREIEGQSFSHAIDPSTGQPVTSDLLSVTVMDRCCMRADALATALFIKGTASGTQFADRHAIPALFLVRTDDGITEIRSRAWITYLNDHPKQGRPNKDRMLNTPLSC